MRRTRPTAAILLAVILQACTGYQTVADPEAGLQASPMQLDKARITLWSGERFKLASPKVDGDSVWGLQADRSMRKIALADVKRFELRVVHPERTMVLTEVVVCSLFSVLGGRGACEPDEEE